MEERKVDKSEKIKKKVMGQFLMAYNVGTRVVLLSFPYKSITSSKNLVKSCKKLPYRNIITPGAINDIWKSNAIQATQFEVEKLRICLQAEITMNNLAIKYLLGS